ncbi:MAG: ComEC/Rec2 family competence protein [Anaerolineales bacterium]
MQTSDPATPSFFENLTAFVPLFWLSLAFLVGILCAQQVQGAVLLWLILAGVALLLVALVRLLLPRLNMSSIKSPRVFLATLCLLAFFLGAWRERVSVPGAGSNDIAAYNDQAYELLVTGTLTDPPDVRDTYTNLRMQVSSVNTGESSLPAHGLILARVAPGENWQYGDVVRLRGRLQTPPTNADFSYQDYLAAQGILAYMPDAEATLLPFTGGDPFLSWVYAFKARVLDQIYRIFPEPEASLVSAILLGDSNGMSAELQQAYRNTGAAQIIVISAFNMVLLASLLVTVFSRLLGRRKGALAAIFGILLYTLLVGATASVVRAAILAGLAIFARQTGRRQNGLNTLAFTSAVMAAINPNVLLDAGFQLACAATFGLVLYAKPFQDWFTELLGRRLSAVTARKIGEPVGGYVFFTLAAQLTVLPFMAYQFGRIPLVALVANPLILPFQPVLELLAGLALLLSFIYLPLGRAAAWIAWPLAAYTNNVVEFFNSFPQGVIVLGEFSFLFVGLFYAGLLFITFAGPSLKQGLRTALAPSVILAALGISVWLAWSAAFAAPDGYLHLTFLDAGSADAILIQTPGGRAILVDGGESYSGLADALGNRLSPFDHRLDWLVVAAPQEQQVAALPRVLELFPAGNVLWSGATNASSSAEQIGLWMSSSATPVTPAVPGLALNLGAGARLEVRSVSPRGAVLLVEWQAFRALLPIGMDINTLTELENGKKIGPVTVLLLADSGFAQVSPPAWIAALRPQVAILSVAAGDPNGLPDQAVLDELNGTSLLRTDRNGWIEVSTDGAGVWVDVEKR